MIDKCIIVPISACVYATIVSPLLIHATIADDPSLVMAARPENKIFWPALAAVAIVLAVRNRSRLSWPPHIICLFAYLAFAGASVLWAFKPEFSFTRFVMQVMIVTSIVLPAMVADRKVDMMRGVFLCFALASILNVFFVLGQPPIILSNGDNIGYPGYFTFKGTLGECAAIAFLLSLHEMLYPGLRRAIGIIVVVVATWLMFVSESKGSLGMAIIAPLLAQLTLIIGKKMRISLAIVPLAIAFCYEVLSKIPGLNIINRISWYLYGNYTLSGRAYIWDFVNYEIGRRPLLGWGYQSFWLVGPDAPSVVEAPGWIAAMPSAHNGYLDTHLDTGYVGFVIFTAFLIATLHAAGRVADRDPARAWLVLSLALYIILTNMLESTWMHGQDILWLMFVIPAAEIGRYWQPFRPDGRSQHRHRFRQPPDLMRRRSVLSASAESGDLGSRPASRSGD
jgi:O-antigen ligase